MESESKVQSKEWMNDSLPDYRFVRMNSLSAEAQSPLLLLVDFRSSPMIW
jgi:hypothetical protein